MDPVAEIKARLPIEELVRQYCQLQKKGRNFVCLCPFHNDTHPSMLVSPDKGIAYCFPCQKGGDIFNFYQLIEGVEFPQAIRDLAERTGVTLPDRPQSGPARDERERLRACLEAACDWFRRALGEGKEAGEYLASRGVTPQEIQRFELGLASADSHALYDELLRQGFSRGEIVGSGIAMQRDLSGDRPIDRFRSRLMFPIRDPQGRMIGFGGRTLVSDDAKYLNSAETPLYRKSSVLYGFPLAKEAMRESRRAVLVEGYFDVLACHRVGVIETVATCGTALTEEHAHLLKRHVDTVVLCLDADRAGRDAAERAFGILAREGIAVRAVRLPEKDPADMAVADPPALASLLAAGGQAYVDLALEELRSTDIVSGPGKRVALERMLPLLQALSTAVERAHYVRLTALLLGVPETAVERDLASSVKNRAQVPQTPAVPAQKSPFSSAGVALGFFLCFPQLLDRLPELIPPEEGAVADLYTALQGVQGRSSWTIDTLELSPETQQFARILMLFCEEHGFDQISESLAARELKKNCRAANRDFLQGKVQEVARKLRENDAAGKDAETSLLQTQFEQLLKLARKVG
ncbi:MAG: DNA primase [Candidatus Peregrinibacteria bacterium Gr01-1014_25]|nr:MAG: DNA primase [Candidatus Peregrinibacteria bacterium Gr01-1014_25]